MTDQSGKIFDSGYTLPYGYCMEKQGHIWSKKDKADLADLFHDGAHLETMCGKLQRSPAGILWRLVAEGLLEHRDGLYYHKGPLKPKLAEPQAPTQVSNPAGDSATFEESETMTAPIIENKTFINGIEANTMCDLEIFRQIAKLEQTIAGLEAIQMKPEKLKAHIAKLRQGVADLASYVDSREGEPA